MKYDKKIHDGLAPKILTALDENHTLTTNLLASQLNAQVQDVSYILDAFEIVNGKPVHRGPGQGGNWIAPEYQVRMEPRGVEEILKDSEHIGFRWPDNSIQDVIFDISNAEHRQLAGVSDEAYEAYLKLNPKRPQK